MMAFIKNLIKRSVVSNIIEDTGNFSITQVKWASSKVSTIEVLLPYGLSSSAPLGSMALMFNIFGQESNQAAIVNYPPKRFKNLKPGEVALGNFLTKSVIKFLENGDIEITGNNDLNVTIAGNINLTVNGNISATIGGDLTANITGNVDLTTGGNISATVGGTLTADVVGNTDITSPIVTIDGEIRASGEITAFYSLVDEISFSDIVTKYNAHKHTSAIAGSPTSSTLAPNTLP